MERLASLPQLGPIQRVRAGIRLEHGTHPCVTYRFVNPLRKQFWYSSRADRLRSGNGSAPGVRAWHLVTLDGTRRGAQATCEKAETPAIAGVSVLIDALGHRLSQTVS